MTTGVVPAFCTVRTTGFCNMVPWAQAKYNGVEVASKFLVMTIFPNTAGPLLTPDGMMATGFAMLSENREYWGY